jgi:hypothetical protein
MLDPDRMFARRCELKMSPDRLAAGMAGRGHRWTAATVSMAESGDRGLTDAETADVEDLLDLTPPPTPAAAGGGCVRVVVSGGPDGHTVEITPDDAAPADVVYALTVALNTILTQQ